MWDQRYSEPGFAYGTEPNAFLVEHAWALEPGGRVLCLAEGEGRNAVWLASRGWDVTAVDTSEVGLTKARALAAERGVPLRTVTADLARYELGEGCWEAVVSIWAHVPALVRTDLHRRVVRALVPGGVLLLEAYTPEQLAHGTGGPPTAALLFPPDEVRTELDGLDLVKFEALERTVREGRYHDGPSAVLQVVARRPSRR